MSSRHLRAAVPVRRPARPDSVTNPRIEAVAVGALRLVLCRAKRLIRPVDAPTRALAIHPHAINAASTEAFMSKLHRLMLGTVLGAGLAIGGGAIAKDLTLCWAAWDPANALVELS